MAVDYFAPAIALDPDTGTVIAGAQAQVYTLEDTSFETPLAITDMSDMPLTALTASPTGIFPSFKVVSGEKQVLVKSGDIVTPLTSVLGLKGDPGDPGPPGEGVDPSGSMPGQVLMSTGPDTPARWSDAPTSGGIAGAPTAWPSEFPATPHTHRAGQITDATTIGRQVMTTEDAQAARAAIGAGTGNGTSNLRIGPGATEAAPGNHSHNASTLPFEPTGSLTATDVQGAIEQAAASGGGGSGVQETRIVMYASGAYPTQPTTPPAGVKVRHFYGPVQYMGPTWPGVLDLYTYAELT